ncbi:polysaccharide deacetylase family protein [Flavobacterium sp.]|jgi:peptidoglycan/xylan/chitin deacetylase (PgdA/CDA1 family)|uniref:polysaccharide deacetylase family protein n=1 Tax=Flavobacterium sp. TaxID=239 RepID=UPI0037C09D83
MILLSFDIEEFDMPLEYQREILFEDQISISRKGTIIILDLLKKYNIKATFFSTVVFAKEVPDLIKRIMDEGHELASHTYFHSDFKIEHLKESKEALEKLSGSKITGFRMPRMYPVDEIEIEKAGYLYNSSINPTFLPGRYNHFDKPRTYFKIANVWQIPASVTPIFRFPLFWLSFHNLPLVIYKFLARWTYKKDNYLNIYFHPWEFTDLNQKKRFNFPNYVSKNTGDLMTNRLENFISWAIKNKYSFGTFNLFLNNYNLK